MEKEYYDAQIKYMNEVRSIRHDMRAHMIVLQYYLEEEKYEKASEYLRKMQSHQESCYSEYMDTGNDLVNVIVQDMVERSTCPVKVVCHGFFPENLPFDDYDICTLFSNLLSNACEACEKLSIHAPEIVIEIGQQEERLLLAVQNPIEWEVDLQILGRSTSKQDKIGHGYGVRNMIDVVKKNHGKIDFYVTDQSFRVEVQI